VTNALAELELAGAAGVPTVDTIGKVVRTTDTYGNAQYVLYDKFARQVATFDATKHRTSASEYDAVDRVIKSKDTFGQTTTISYAVLFFPPVGLNIPPIKLRHRQYIGRK
jgi:YD repeat-containing protein